MKKLLTRFLRWKSFNLDKKIQNKMEKIIMYSLELTWLVHLGRYIYDEELNQTVSERIGVFVKMIDIPFIPFIGLGLQDKKWSTPPIYTVKYAINSNIFLCKFQEDTQIPTKAKSIIDAENIDWRPDDINEYLEFASSHKIKKLMADGWDYRCDL